MLKWITPAVLSVSVLGALAAPARAQDRRYYDRYDRTSRYYRDDRANDLADRANDIRRRTDRLYRDGRLSRDHRDRIMDRLDRVYSDMRDGNMSRNRINSNHDWLDRTERTLDQWSRR